MGGIAWDDTDAARAVRARPAVLIVDDHVPNLLAMGSVLESLGVELVFAESGAEALGHLLDREFALILLDVMMPDLDGFATAEMIRGRAKTASTPIIFVTAKSFATEDVLRGYAVGAVDYLTKPIDPEIVRAKVRVFVELHHARDEIKHHTATLVAARVESGRAAAYRFIAENIPQQVWTAAPDGALDYVNPVVLDYFARSAEEILGEGWRNLVHPDDGAVCIDRWNASLATGQPYDVEFRLRRHDGRYRWHLGRAVAERDDSGCTLRWFGTNTDIDDAKRVEADLRAAVRGREDLLATVSHDLRGPLSAIVLAAELIRPNGDEVLRKSRDSIARAAARMDSLIRDLLDLASIETGHLSIELATSAVADVLKEAAEAITEVAAAKQLELVVVSPSSLLDIVADRGRLQQVLANILGNAVKFTPRGGRISLRATEHDDRFVLFSISDTGHGIRPDELPFVFDRFWRARNSVQAGTGLGLAICKGIVERHGGSIWVESRHGIGTTFFFTVAVAPSASVIGEI